MKKINKLTVKHLVAISFAVFIFDVFGRTS